MQAQKNGKTCIHALSTQTHSTKRCIYTKKKITCMKMKKKKEHCVPSADSAIGHQLLCFQILPVLCFVWCGQSSWCTSLVFTLTLLCFYSLLLLLLCSAHFGSAQNMFSIFQRSWFSYAFAIHIEQVHGNHIAWYQLKSSCTPSCICVRCKKRQEKSAHLSELILLLKNGRRIGENVWSSNGICAVFWHYFHYFQGRA